jgi:hypothetical protein
MTTLTWSTKTFYVLLHLLSLESLQLKLWVGTSLCNLAAQVVEVGFQCDGLLDLLLEVSLGLGCAPEECH